MAFSLITYYNIYSASPRLTKHGNTRDVLESSSTFRNTTKITIKFYLFVTPTYKSTTYWIIALYLLKQTLKVNYYDRRTLLSVLYKNRVIVLILHKIFLSCSLYNLYDEVYHIQLLLHLQVTNFVSTFTQKKT